MRSLFVCIVASCLQALSLSAVSAALGGTAERNDNCTPFNVYQIGIPLADGSTLVDQSVVLADGWDLMGWLIISSNGKRSLVPYAGYVAAVDGSKYPTGYISLTKYDAAVDYQAVVSYIVHSSLASLPRRPDLTPPRRVLVASCFAAPLVL
jgi:hypothetical protein